MAKTANPDLAKQIETRKKFLAKVVKFAHDILLERGKIIERNEHSAHTHIIRELLDFEGFSFRGDWGQTMFGGDHVVITYRPGHPKLRVYCQGAFDINECKVEFFDGDPRWQAELLKMIRNKKAITRKLDNQKSKFVKQAKKTLQSMRDEDKLKSEAARLGVR